MKTKILTFSLLAFLIFAVSCEKETINNTSIVDDELLATITDEVLADINFADLLSEGDDGIFWGDNAFSSLKSTEIVSGCWSKRTKVEEGDKVVITLEYEGDCDKYGIIIIEYLKPNDNSGAKKKTITYQNFIKNEVTFNGTKDVVRGNDNYSVKGEMTVEKKNDDGEDVLITRNYEKQIKWICGLDTKNNKEDNILKITGETEVTKTVGEVEKSYKRKILKPLLIVKVCDLKVQAGLVKIEKGDGTEIEIDYGKMPDNIDCESDFECGTTFEITKDGKTYQMELVEGKRVKVTTDE